MQIQKGKYRLQDRGLHFDLIHDLDLQNSASCFYFKGDNGFGKTSFLEKIIIPSLGAEKINYLYIGQDIRTQLYTLKALLSIQGHKIAGTDEVALLKLWINQGRSAKVFILDEFDKYFPDYKFIFDCSESFIRTYIFVTHRKDHPPDRVARKSRVCRVRFEMIGFDGLLKNVRVKKE